MVRVQWALHDNALTTVSRVTEISVLLAFCVCDMFVEARVKKLLVSVKVGWLVDLAFRVKGQETRKHVVQNICVISHLLWVTLSQRYSGT